MLNVRCSTFICLSLDPFYPSLGSNRNNQTLLDTLELLTKNNITVHSVTTTSFRISLLVPREHVDQSVQLCHDRWVTSK